MEKVEMHFIYDFAKRNNSKVLHFTLLHDYHALYDKKCFLRCVLFSYKLGYSFWALQVEVTATEKQALLKN